MFQNRTVPSLSLSLSPLSCLLSAASTCGPPPAATPPSDTTRPPDHYPTAIDSSPTSTGHAPERQPRIRRQNKFPAPHRHHDTPPPFCQSDASGASEKQRGEERATPPTVPLPTFPLMTATRRWESSSHYHCAVGGGGGRGRSRYHLVREDFRRRMMAFRGLEQKVVPGRISGREESREVLFMSARKKRSKVDPRVVMVKAEETRKEGEGEKKGTGKERSGGFCPVAVDGDSNKACVICRTTKTPLWRSGPAGPKTLCNACGLRYRKMRRKGLVESSGNFAEGSTSAASFLSGYVPAPEDEVLKQRQRRKQEGLWLLLQQSRKFASTCGKEEAEAAVLLMALSTGLFVHSSS